MNSASGNGRLVVRARRGGRGASGFCVAAALPFVLACGGAEGAGVSDLALVTSLEVGDSLSARARPAAYAGVIPCEGCPSEPSTLVLHLDGSYRLRTPSAARESVSATVVIGRWIVSDDSVPVLSLRRDGTAQEFEMASALRLRLIGAREGAARELVRVAAPATLGGRVVLRGEFRDEASGPSLVTCDGGHRFPLRGGEALAALMRAHEAHPLGDWAATRVEVVGRLDSRGGTGTEQSAVPEEIVLDSFTPLPASASCETMRVRATIAVGDWVATAIDRDSLPALSASITPSLRFVLSEPTMYGNAGCSRFTGRAVLRGLDLEPLPVALTRRACADSTVMARETRYSQILSAGGWFRLEGAELVLSQGGTEVARFRRR